MAKINLIFEALADPTRRKILNLLHSRDLTPGEMIESFAISKPALTHHLNVLKRADLVITERKGQNIIYSLNMSVFEEITQILFDIFRKKSGARPPDVQDLLNEIRDKDDSNIN